MKKIATTLGAAVLAGTMLTGCIGQFALTSTVYDWNKSVGNKWLAEGVFLVLNILPVYGITFFVDGIVINSIEFWTGSNPLSGKKAVVKAGDQKEVKGKDGSIAVMTYRADKSIAVDYTTSKGEKGSIILVKEDNSVSLFNGRGQMLAQANDKGQLTNTQALAMGKVALPAAI